VIRASTKSLGYCALGLALAGAGGCSGVSGISGASVLIPPDQIAVSKSLVLPMESIAAGALLFVIIDPLAPNWEIGQSKIDADRYRIALKKKRFTTGGDGEALQVFRRRAAEIAREQGAGDYRLVEYTEGIESNVLIAQRVAQGVIEIVR
jgi:hypothetical protein